MEPGEETCHMSRGAPLGAGATPSSVVGAQKSDCEDGVGYKTGLSR